MRLKNRQFIHVASGSSNQSSMSARMDASISATLMTMIPSITITLINPRVHITRRDVPALRTPTTTLKIIIVAVPQNQKMHSYMRPAHDNSHKPTQLPHMCGINHFLYTFLVGITAFFENRTRQISNMCKGKEKGRAVGGGIYMHGCLANWEYRGLEDSTDSVLFTYV